MFAPQTKDALADRVQASGIAEYVLVARRNNSLSHAGRVFALGFIFSVSLGIATGFFLACGAWLVLPFAGLEMAVLFLAFRYIDRHAGDYDCVVIAGSSVSIEVMEGGAVRRYELNRYWAQLVACGEGGRIALRSHGREVEIGRHLCAEQRESVARQLKRQLRRAA